MPPMSGLMPLNMGIDIVKLGSLASTLQAGKRAVTPRFLGVDLLPCCYAFV